MPTPVRNVRIDDALWEKLGRLAKKRNTSITALLLEGANLLLASTKVSKPTSVPQNAIISTEVWKRLETIESTLQALSVHDTVQHVQETLVALEQRILALESQVSKGQHQIKAVHGEIQPEVKLEGKQSDKATVQLSVQTEVQRSDDRDQIFTQPLTQGELALRLGKSDTDIKKARRKGTHHFAIWSRENDPNELAWVWYGEGRGHPIQFVPLQQA